MRFLGISRAALILFSMNSESTTKLYKHVVVEEDWELPKGGVCCLCLSMNEHEESSCNRKLSASEALL